VALRVAEAGVTGRFRTGSVICEPIHASYPLQPNGLRPTAARLDVILQFWGNVLLFLLQNA